MKKFLILLFALFIVNGTMAQDCLPEGITFTTQAQIDDFQTNYPNCNQIWGDMTIMGSNITNLNGLSNLNSIGGTLSINNNDILTNLSGLNSLVSIGGSLFIGGYSGGNPSLASLSGLNSLLSISGNLTINSNDVLTNLSGLNALSGIGGSVIIGSYWGEAIHH